MKTILPALAALALGALPGDPPATRPEVVYEFRTLTPEHAQPLEGEEATYLIELDSLLDEDGRYTLLDCKSADDVLRTVRLLSGRVIKTRMKLRAVLSISHHPGYAAGDGTVFPDVVQYRLLDAAQER